MNYIHYMRSLNSSRKVCAEMLGCNVEQLVNRPDFREVTDLSVDAVRELIQWCDLAGQKVVLVVNAETLEMGAANALLKVLEENEDVSFIFNAKHALISTIESRCRNEYAAESREDMTAFINSNYPYMLISDPDLPDRVWMFTHDEDVADGLLSGTGPLGILTQIDKNFDDFTSTPKKLLKVLGLLAEKNTDSFFDKYNTYLSNLIGYFIAKFTEKTITDKVAAKIKRLSEHLLLTKRNNYTKADFIQLIINIAQ